MNNYNHTILVVHDSKQFMDKMNSQNIITALNFPKVSVLVSINGQFKFNAMPIRLGSGPCGISGLMET